MTNPLIVDVLRGATSERPPFWFMRQAGRYLPEYRELRTRMGSFLDLCLTPKQAAEVTLQPIRRFHPDGAILFSDILIIPFGLGQSVWFEEGRGPVLEPLDTVKDLSRLSLDRDWSRIEATYETVTRVRADLPSRGATFPNALNLNIAPNTKGIARDKGQGEMSIGRWTMARAKGHSLFGKLPHADLCQSELARLTTSRRIIRNLACALVSILWISMLKEGIKA